MWRIYLLEGERYEYGDCGMDGGAWLGMGWICGLID